MRRILLTLTLALLAGLLFGVQPLVSGLQVSQRTDGSMLVDISYDLEDPDSDFVTITLEVSSDSGQTWNITPDPENLAGDIGEGVTPGNGKTIVWDIGAEGLALDGDTFRFLVTAEDFDSPEMIFIPAGSFVMGDTNDDGEGDADELPVHTVNLDAYWIGKYEVTQQRWAEVMGSNPSHFSGYPQRPVENVSWFNCVSFCNALSLEAGLTPCYTIDGDQVSCDFTANGFRLPTEAEWEYAARGATNDPDYRYAGSNTLSTVAWFVGNASSNTHTVGLKQENSAGTHDQSGNVYEWCWDWRDNGYYSNAPSLNPTGPETGTTRIRRGGCWFSGTASCRVTDRNGSTPTTSNNSLGFRLARSAPGWGTAAAPAQPFSPTPDDQSSMVSLTPTLSWSCSHPDGLPLSYDVYLSQVEDALSDCLLASAITDTTFTPPALQPNTTYWWKVVASDGNWVNVSPVWEFETVNPPEMILVPGGTFQMGDTHGVGEADELPVHTVNLDAFYIGKYEVTQQEWVDVMGTNPSHFTGDMERPVEQVSWYSVVKYCNYRSIQEGLTPVYSVSGDTNPDNWGGSFTSDVNWSANGYRLPTEAEWEYGARGASNTPDYLYAGSDNIDDVAWYTSNSGSQTHLVGHKQANGIGTYDQSGNVWEWCWDWYASYSSGEQTNPCGPETGIYRVIRGGSLDNISNGCRVVIRDIYNPISSTINVGFRLARSVTE